MTLYFPPASYPYLRAALEHKKRRVPLRIKNQLLPERVRDFLCDKGFVRMDKPKAGQYHRGSFITASGANAFLTFTGDLEQ